MREYAPNVLLPTPKMYCDMGYIPKEISPVALNFRYRKCYARKWKPLSWTPSQIPVETILVRGMIPRSTIVTPQKVILHVNKVKTIEYPQLFIP